MKPHVIAFEGLFSFWPAGYVRNGLLKPLAEKHPDKFTYEVYSWFWGRPKIPKDCGALIIVGHSFGGKRAIEFANENEIYATVTMDPRMQPPAAKNDRTYNYYQQSSGLKGFKVDMASNILLKDVSHTQIPYSIFPRMTLEKLLGLA